MQVGHLSSDRISTLPQNINEQILSLLPIRDAVRTSILSKKWRYYWASIPKVVFCDMTFQVPSNNEWYKKYKFVNAISHVLMLRRCPLLHFGLSIDRIKMHSEIDQIILHLSLNNTLKSFFIVHTPNNKYKLPSSFFSLHRLEKLHLESCAFEPPLTFSGFSMMRNLSFSNGEITAMVLQHLLINCPLLEKFKLIGDQQLFTEGSKFTFVELLECLPSIVDLELSHFYIKYFAAGGIPPQFSTSLEHLKYIHLRTCLMSQDELSLVLCLIRSSPKLEKIEIRSVTTQNLLVQQASMNFRDQQDYSTYYLNHLECLEIAISSKLPIEMEFVKFIMVRSPVLKKVRIMLLGTNIVSFSVDEELKMFRDLTQHPYPRASPSAEVSIENYSLYSFRNLV